MAINKMELPLPVLNMDGGERSIMDGLWQDFAITMVNLTHMVLADTKIKPDVEYRKQASKDAPEYVFKKTLTKDVGAVLYEITSLGRKFTVTVDIDRTEPREYIEIYGEPINGLSAFALFFCKEITKSA